MLLCCRSEGLAERDMESLGVMGWGLAAAENSGGGVGVVTGGGGPLDFREIIFFSGNFQKSMILLVFIGQNSKKSKF